MILNQVTLPSRAVARGAAFYRLLGFVQIVEALPHYSRFEIPDGLATLSLELLENPLPAPLRDPDGNELCLYHAGENRRFPPWRLASADRP